MSLNAPYILFGTNLMRDLMPETRILNLRWRCVGFIPRLLLLGEMH